MKRFFYHYYATARSKNTEYSIDGIADMSGQLLTMEDYDALKEVIVSNHPELLGLKVCIESLSLLGDKK